MSRWPHDRNVERWRGPGIVVDIEYDENAEVNAVTVAGVDLEVVPRTKPGTPEFEAPDG